MLLPTLHGESSVGFILVLRTSYYRSKALSTHGYNTKLYCF